MPTDRPTLETKAADYVAEGKALVARAEEEAAALGHDLWSMKAPVDAARFHLYVLKLEQAETELSSLRERIGEAIDYISERVQHLEIASESVLPNMAGARKVAEARAAIHDLGYIATLLDPSPADPEEKTVES